MGDDWERRDRIPFIDERGMIEGKRKEEEQMRGKENKGRRSIV